MGTHYYATDASRILQVFHSQPGRENWLKDQPFDQRPRAIDRYEADRMAGKRTPEPHDPLRPSGPPHHRAPGRRTREVTNDHVRNMTQEQWHRAVAAAEAYGRALETGDRHLTHIPHRRALAAGCLASDLNSGLALTGTKA